MFLFQVRLWYDLTRGVGAYFRTHNSILIPVCCEKIKKAFESIAEIKLRAERRIGEFSRDLPKTDSFTRFGRASHDGKPESKTSILEEAGITHPERYEAIASLPDEVFERIQDLLFWV